MFGKVPIPMKSLFILALLVLPPSYADEADTDSWKHPEPITYESLRAWHAIHRERNA